MSNAANEWTSAQVHALPTSAQSDDVEISLGELFAIFWRRKWLIFLAMLLSMILGVFYVQQLPNLYSADAKLILEAQGQNAAGLDSIVPGISGEDSELNSQIEVIKSRRLIGQVVDRLNLAADPEFVSELRDPSLRLRVTSWIQAQLGITPGTNQTEPRERAIDTLTGVLRASVVPNTHVFRISLETQDSLKSKTIVNTLAQAFVEDQVTAKLESTSQAAIWLAKKVAELGEALGEAEAKAADFRTRTERAVTEADLAQSNQNLKNARGRLSNFLRALEDATGSPVPVQDRDVARKQALEFDVAKISAIVEEQTEDLLAIRQLDREALAAGTIYEHFVRRLNEIEVQQGIQESDVRILSSAVQRFQRTKPKKTLTVAIFGIFGLLLSAGYILAHRFMDKSFKDPAELQRTFGIPVIGAIARAPTAYRKTLLDYALKRPSSAIMESIRDLRTSLMLPQTLPTPDGFETCPVLVMTSSVSSEGKTTSSILLALNSASLDKRVLLVECDLRRSTFKTYFGRPTRYDLVNAIRQDENWEDAIWTKPGTNLDVIFGGVSKGQNAADIFASPEFSDFVDRMKIRYDLIVLDSPPVLPVPDARLIAKVSDKIIYVVRSGSTQSSTVRAGLRLFENIGVKIDGLTLTQTSTRDGYGYGSEYYNN